MRADKFIQGEFYVVGKDATIVPLTFNPVQQKLFDESREGSRHIILKNRQMGVSTLILALFTLDFLTKDNSRSVVISHETSATQKLFDRVKFFLAEFERKNQGKIGLKYNSRSELVNEDNGASFYVGTAGSRAFGRGDTIHNLHFSEPAFYQDAERIVVGASQAVPEGGRIYVESTANGHGNWFQREWIKAERGESIYNPHFYSYLDFPEYTPEFLDSKRKELGDLFKQEYPKNPQEAFLASGEKFYPIPILEKLLEKAKEPLLSGHLGPDGQFL